MRPSTLRTAMLLVALVAFAAAAAGIPARASSGARTTADEPHYLLTALSIAEDGDLDVAPQYARAEYRPFHAPDLPAQARPDASGRLVEPHDPLLPLLLAGPAALGGWVGAKLALSLMAAALAALTLWIAVRRFAVALPVAAPTVGVLAASAPLAAYGSQVYPEIAAALAVAAGVAAVTGRLGRGGLVAVALAVTALPWLSVKYAPVAAALAALALWRLARDRRRAAALALAGGLALAAVAYLVAHRALYGGVTPYASGSFFVDGQMQVVGSDPDYAGRARRITGLLVDRDFGIAAWQPAWLLLAPALGALAARRPRGAAALVLPLAAGWFVATFVALTMQGWWFPGRQLVAVLPLAAVAIAWWARDGGRRLAAVLVLGAAGVLAQAWVAVEGARAAITWVVTLQETTNPLYRAWRPALPDYLDVTAGTWVLHWTWTAVLAGAAVLAYRRARPARAGASGETRMPVEDAAAGAAVLYSRVLRPWHMTWGATPEEAAGPVAGDGLLPDAAIVATRVVEIDAPPWAVWPWLVQMGPGRGGAYTYDWIERRLGVDVRNVDRVVPELQGLRVGDAIPMPGYAMRVEVLDRERAMVVRSDDGAWVWAFELRPVGDGRTRLVSRNRIDTSRARLRDRLGYPVMEPGSWVMERKMLLTIRRLAERLAREGERVVPAAPPPAPGAGG